MSLQSYVAVAAAHKRTAPLLTTKEAAQLLHASVSWMAKARMRGHGPFYISIGRAIRYREEDLIQWIKERRRLSTRAQ